MQRARERGIVVTLLDEGGIDDLDEATRDRVLVAPGRGASRPRRPTGSSPAPAAEASAAAVTVVGLRRAATACSRSDETDEDEVELWLEIPRVHRAR